MGCLRARADNIVRECRYSFTREPFDGGYVDLGHLFCLFTASSFGSFPFSLRSVQILRVSECIFYTSTKLVVFFIVSLQFVCLSVFQSEQNSIQTDSLILTRFLNGYKNFMVTFSCDVRNTLIIISDGAFTVVDNSII